MPDSPVTPGGTVAASETAQPEETSPRAESWRAPVTVQVKSVLSAAIGVAVAVVFFPVAIAVPVAVLLAAWGLGMGARRPAVALDPGSGLLTVRMGFLTRRVALADIAVVQLEGAKVTFGKADGTAVSVQAWQRGRLDRWLRVPVVAGDMAHTVSKAASVARPQQGEKGAGARTRSGKNLPLLVMTAAGVLEIAAVFFVRVSWPSPAMTALGALVALGFGFTGVFTIVFALWTYLTGRSRLVAGLRRGHAHAAGHRVAVLPRVLRDARDRHRAGRDAG